jgi:hypothetical protein
MNTQLEKLLTQYNLSQKDQYEIRQIYALLPKYKQHNLLQNFWNLASRLVQIEEEIREEREILVWDKVENIKNIILHNREKRVKNHIEQLKNEL